MRAEGTFIAVDVDDALAGDAELARALTDACPVDIFAQDARGALELRSENLDECVLCRLCLDAVAERAPGAVQVIKLYDNDAILA